MSKLYDHKSGKWVEAPDDQIDDLVLSGSHTFESGIDIPVVGPSGELMTIKSDEAHDAFKEGFRWQTQQDRDSDFDLQSYRIKKEHFDNLDTAVVGGVLRGATMGGSDVVLEGMGLGEETKLTKDFSPVASGLGAAAGVVGSVVAAPAGLLARGGKAAYTAGEGIAGAATGMLGAGRAARAIDTIAKTAAGSLAEGAYYGVGEGISEAALGQPEDIVNNLAAGVGLGALAGGAFGAVLGTGKAVAPYLKQAFAATSDGAQGLVTKVARGVEKNRVRASLTREGEEQLAKEYSAIADSPAYEQIRQMHMDGEFQAAKELRDEILKGRKLLEAEQKDLRKGIQTYIKSATETEQQALGDALQEAGGDAWKASRGIYKKIQDTSNQFREAIHQFTDPADVARVTDSALYIDGVAAKLDDIGTAESRRWAKSIRSYGAKNFQPGINEADEFIALDNLKRNVLDYPQIVKIPDGRVRKELIDLWKFSKQSLTEPESTIREEFKAFSRGLDDDYTAYNALRDILGRKTLKAGSIAKLATDPGKLDAIDPLFRNYAQFVPELSALKSAAGNAQARTKVLEQIRSKISDMKMQSVNGQLSLDDLGKIIDEAGFTKHNPMTRVQRMEEIGQWLRQVDNRSPLDAAVYLERQLKGGPSKLEKYLPFEEQMGVLDRLSKVKGGGDSLLKTATAGQIGAGIGYTVGGPVGAKVGGFVGGAAGGWSGMANKSPLAIMRGLSKVERSAHAGIKKIQAASGAAVDALTSAKFKTANIAYQSYTPDRKRFKEVSENIKKMLNPDEMLNVLADMPASDVPGIHQALAAKMSSAVTYLNSHMPEDPTAAYSIFPGKSHWVPSDHDLTKFTRRVEVVNDPTIAIARIAEGTVTPEQVDALKNVYPEIYQGLQQELISGMMESKEPPSYKSRLILAHVFNIPADFSMTPQFLQSMQATFVPQDQGGRPTGSPDAQPRGNPQKSIDIKPMETMSTPGQDLAFRTDIK